MKNVFSSTQIPLQFLYPSLLSKYLWWCRWLTFNLHIVNSNRHKLAKFSFKHISKSGSYLLEDPTLLDAFHSVLDFAASILGEGLKLEPWLQYKAVAFQSTGVAYK